MASEKAMGKTPDFLLAGPFEYGIEFNGEDAYEHDHMGCCSYRMKRIRLDPRQADTDLPQTLLHECLHALGNAYEIREWTEHKYEDGKPIDKIDLMATALLTFIRENKSLIDWLQEQR